MKLLFIGLRALAREPKPVAPPTGWGSPHLHR